MKVNYYNRLISITSDLKKVDIASKLGISRQRLNYYFRTQNIPKSFLTKKIKRKITYLFSKGTTKARANGLRKIYKIYNYNRNSMFTKIKLFAYGLPAMPKDILLQAQVFFERTDNGNIYAPTTQVFSLIKGGFELFKQELIALIESYNIVDKNDDFINGSTSVYFDKKVKVTFMY